jgi:hypothetical protein
MRLVVLAGLLLASAACSEQQARGSQDSPLQDFAVRVRLMDEAQFWSLIDASVEGSPPQDVQEGRLAAALGRLPAEDIAAFDTMFWVQVGRAYTWDLWGAAYIIHGGASDDSFEYFRRWLLSRGKATFEAALRDPDSLADLIPATQSEPAEFEDFPYIAANVWKSKTGFDPYAATSDVGFFDTKFFAAAIPNEPPGEPFEEDPDYLAKRWPKLWERFGDSPLP